MKKLLAIVVLSFLFNNILLAEEYPNSWKMDILCKQGKYEWYESAFVVNVENNKFSLGPFNSIEFGTKNIKFKGKIEANKIKISHSLTFKDGYQANVNYSGEFINDKEAILKGGAALNPPWKCNGRFFKVNRPPHFIPLKYLSEATELSLIHI